MLVFTRKKEGKVYRASIDLPEDIHFAVKRAADERGQTTRGFFICLVREFLKGQQNAQQNEANA